MSIEVRTWGSEPEFWAWVLELPATVVVDGEAFVSPEELWGAYLAGFFSDYRDLPPEESGYDDKAFHELAPDYAAWSDRVWSWAQFWDSHLREYAANADYARRFDDFRGAHNPGEPPEMVTR